MSILQLTSATSGTVTAQDTQQPLTLIHDAGTTLTLTVAFPATPVNGQTFTITSAGGVTTLTITASTGSVIAALASLAVGGTGTWIYGSTGNKWYKIV